jgi:hypothetical protein
MKNYTKSDLVEKHSKIVESKDIWMKNCCKINKFGLGKN